MVPNTYNYPDGPDGEETVRSVNHWAFTWNNGDFSQAKTPGLYDYLQDVKNQLIEAGCGPSCVEDVLTASRLGQEVFETVAETCGCPDSIEVLASMGVPTL